MRWTIYFEFAQGPVIACEAVVEDNKLSGRLTPLKERNPADTEVCIGKHKIVYGDVWKAFLCISSASDYHAEENNSQTWAFKLLKSLDIPVPYQVSAIASGRITTEKQARTLEDLDSDSEVAYRSQCRDCEVWLGFSRIGGGFASFFSSSANWRCFMHWSVDLKVIDGALYRCHAGAEDGRLRGKQEVISKQTPLKKQILLGIFKLSETQIERVMRQMAECGMYDKVRNNCQIWAVKFLDKLKIPIPDEVRTIAQKVGYRFPTADESEYKDMVEMVEESFE